MVLNRTRNVLAHWREARERSQAGAQRSIFENQVAVRSARQIDAVKMGEVLFHSPPMGFRSL
jgi:hypothetical protein